MGNREWPRCSIKGWLDDFLCSSSWAMCKSWKIETRFDEQRYDREDGTENCGMMEFQLDRGPPLHASFAVILFIDDFCVVIPPLVIAIAKAIEC